MPILNRLLILLLVTSLSACASLDKRNWTAERYYKEAKTALDNKDYESAIQYYEELEAAYPYGEHAEQAQLDVTYAYFKGGEPESAIASADRFIKLHPRHPQVEYAYYLRGLASFEQNRNFLYGVFNQDPNHRESDNARRSFNYFAELVKKYPDGKYSKDALQRMVQLRNSLASYEIYIANYYLNREAYLAAANRAKYVVEHYQNTPSVAEALTIMAKAYKYMGMNDLSDDALRVLRLNHPTHPGIVEVEQIPAK